MNDIDTTGLKLFTAENTSPLRAALHKNGRLSFNDATAKALNLSTMRGAYFAEEESTGALMLLLNTHDMPGVFAINGNVISSQHFFTGEGSVLAQGAKRFEVIKRNAGLFELKPIIKA